MMGSDQELEIKLYISNLPAIEQRLKELGASQTKPRLHEFNLRFDNQDGELTNTAQILRLRRDNVARITYKSPGEIVDGVYTRREIEFTVSDFDAARSFFEALGYQVNVIYEKYRTTYEHKGTEITLDEMPYGDFAEIEGQDAQGIHSVAKDLGVNRKASIPKNYTELFEHLRTELGFTFRDLTFENFANLEVTPEALGVTPADEK